MADEAETPDNDELLLTEEVEQPDEQRSDDDEPDTNVNDEGEEEVYSFGDDVADEKEGDTNLAKHLRDEIKKRDRELAELRRSVRQPEAIEVGEKPTLAGCEYDEEAFEVQLDAWKERKAAADRQATEQTQASETQRQQWEAELQEVAQEKAALNRPDADDAFDIVRTALSDHQNIALLQTVDKGNRAKLIYALAKNPAQLESLTKLGGEQNLIRFIKEVTKLEGQLKMVKRRTAPAPEETQRGSASAASASAYKKLEKLQKEANRTGDRTALIAYKKTLGK